MVHQIAFAIMCVSALVSCATVGRLADPDYFKKQSSMQLCMDLLTSPTSNVNRTARIEELSRRGENCSQYTLAAAVQAQRDQQAIDSLQNAARPDSPPPPSPPVTCYTRGALTTCQ